MIKINEEKHIIYRDFNSRDDDMNNAIMNYY